METAVRDGNMYGDTVVENGGRESWEILHKTSKNSLYTN